MFQGEGQLLHHALAFVRHACHRARFHHRNRLGCAAVGAEQTPAFFVQQVATDDWQADQGHTHSECSLVRRGGREFVPALGSGTCKQPLQFSTREALLIHHAAREQLLPSQLGGVFIHCFLSAGFGSTCERTCDATRGSRLLVRQGHRRRRQEDGFVDGFGRHRASLDAMQVGGFVIAKWRGLKTVNLYIVFGGQARVLRRKLRQNGCPHLRAKQGLFVVQQHGRQKLALQVHHHQDVDRFAAVAAHWFEIHGLEGVSDEGRLGADGGCFSACWRRCCIGARGLRCGGGACGSRV